MPRIREDRCPKASPSRRAPTRRFRASMSRARIHALLVPLILLVACQSPSPPTRSTSSETPADLAARALAAGRYAEAAQLYREALDEAPGKMQLHYGLAVVSSFLDLRDEAIREFRWVLQYGSPGAPEVEASRAWLARAGALPVAYDATNPSRPDEGACAGQAGPRRASRVRGGREAAFADAADAALLGGTAEQSHEAGALQSAHRRAGQLQVPGCRPGALQAHQPGRRAAHLAPSR